MSSLRSIILVFLGISLIGTVLQNKIRVWENSQNMFFGCIGALIAYAFQLSIIWIIILWILCMIISYIVFQHIKTDIFDTKSNVLIKIANLVGIIIILLGSYLLIFSQFNIPIFNKNIGLHILIVSVLWILFSDIRSIPLFINVTKTYNPDEFSDEDTVYIYKSFWHFHNYDYQYYNNKKINIVNLKQIINKKCIVYQNKSLLYIHIGNKEYLIKELNNQEIQEGDTVKISKENLKKGVIKPDDIVIIEKIQSTNTSTTTDNHNITNHFSTPIRNHRFPIIMVIFILLGIFIIGLGFYKQYKNTQFFKNAKITTANVIDIERIDNTSGENDTISYFCDVEYTIDEKIYKSNIDITPLMDYEQYEQFQKGKKFIIKIYYNLNNYLDIKLPIDKNDYSIIIIGILWTIICLIFGYIFKKQC